MSSTQSNVMTLSAQKALDERREREKQKEFERSKATQQGPAQHNTQILEAQTGSIKIGKGIRGKANTGNFYEGKNLGLTQKICDKTGEVEAEELGEEGVVNSANSARSTDHAARTVANE